MVSGEWWVVSVWGGSAGRAACGNDMLNEAMVGDTVTPSEIVVA